MPPPFGIVPEGFNPKTQEEIKTDLEAGYRGVFGAGVNLDPSESTFGIEIGIISERLAEVWQAAQAVYNAAFPDGAEDVNLVNIGAITGVAKLAATRSHVIVSCYPTGTPGSMVGFTIPINTELSIVGLGIKFRNPVAVVVPSTLIMGGGEGAPTTGEWVAVDTGPAQVPTGSLTVINTPVVGLGRVNNLADQSILGTNEETDAAFRARREDSLRGLGNNSIDAIVARVAAISNVTDCVAFENLTDVTDANHNPPHSFEIVVSGGTDAAIAQAISDARPATGRSYGTTSAIASDANGFDVNILFSRPDDKNVYVTINVKVANVNTFPAGSVTLIKERVAATIRRIGQSVSASSLLAEIDQGDIPEIVEFPTLPLIGFSASPNLSITLVFTNHEKAAFDTSRVVVSLS